MSQAEKFCCQPSIGFRLNMMMPGEQALGLLTEFSRWGNTTTIIIHGGCVFEFKGVFPAGDIAHGYYNLQGEAGFQGHIKLDNISSVSFQDSPHRGRTSYAFVFNDAQNQVIFKVFLGRDESGELLASQVDAFKQLQAKART